MDLDMCLRLFAPYAASGQCDWLLGRLGRRPVECTVRVQTLPGRRAPRVVRVCGRHLGARTVVRALI